MIFDNISEVNIRIKSKNFSGYLFFIKIFQKGIDKSEKCAIIQIIVIRRKEKKGKCDMITQI